MASSPSGFHHPQILSAMSCMKVSDKCDQCSDLLATFASTVLRTPLFDSSAAPYVPPPIVPIALHGTVFAGFA